MLRELFRTADLTPCEYTLLIAMWDAAGNPTGKEIQFFASVEGYRIEARWKSRRTVQRNLHRLAKVRGVIELTHGANTIRRPATYRLRTDRLGQRQTYTDFKNQRKAVAHFPRHQASSVPSAAPPASPTVERAAASTPVPPAAAPRQENSRLVDLILDGSRKAERVRKLRAELGTRIAELIAGCERYIGREGWVELQPNHPEYRLAMPRDQAFRQACVELTLTEAEGRELLKFMEPHLRGAGHEVPDEEPQEE